MQLLQNGKTSIAAAIVHKNDLVGPPQILQDRVEVRVQLL
jgi:hypothetical protein